VAAGMRRVYGRMTCPSADLAAQPLRKLGPLPVNPTIRRTNARANRAPSTGSDALPSGCADPAIERKLGSGAGELTNASYAVFTHPDDLDASRDLYRELLAGERAC